MDSNEQILQAMEARTDSREGDRWRDMLDIYRLLAPLPDRSQAKSAMQKEIATRTHYKPATQGQAVRIVRTCADPETGEVRLPFRLHWSTALEMVNKGASREEIIRADTEGWTLTQAKAYMQGRSIVRDPKGKALWGFLTSRIPRSIRKETGALSPEQVTELVQGIRAAAAEWGAQVLGEGNNG
jgi:hypothetical protein